MTKTTIITLVLALGFGSLGCKQKEQTKTYQEVAPPSLAPKMEAQQMPAGHPPVPGMPAAEQGAQAPVQGGEALPPGHPPLTEGMAGMPAMGAGAPQPAAGNSPFSWKKPDAWQEMPASGMRLASFAVEKGGEKADCSVIVLGGEAGGLEANVKRWADQLAVNLSQAEFSTFMAKQTTLATKGATKAMVVDFTPVTAKADAVSMLGAVIQYPSETIFIKLMGKKAILEGERANFNALAASLEKKAEAKP